MNKKNEILAATIERFYKDGEHFTLDDVAKDVSCSKTLIIRYYGTKNNLVDSCFDYICHEMINLFSAKAELLNDNPIENYYREIWDTYIRYLVDNPSKANMYYFYSMRYKQYPSGYKSPLQVVAKIIGPRYEELKTIHPNFDLVTGYIVSVANILAMNINSGWLKNDDNTKVDVIDMILYGVIKHQGRP